MASEPIKLVAVVIIVIGMLAIGIGCLVKVDSSSSNTIIAFETKANEILGESTS